MSAILTEQPISVEASAGTRLRLELVPDHVMMHSHIAISCLDLPERLGSASNLSTHALHRVTLWRPSDDFRTLSTGCSVLRGTRCETKHGLPVLDSNLDH